MRRRWKDDGALATFSDTAAVLMMIATVTGAATTVFVWLAIREPAEPPLEMELVSVGGIDADGGRTFLVANVSRPANWSAVTVLFDGKTLVYSGALEEAFMWCLSRDGVHCVSEGVWSPESEPVLPGQYVRIQAHTYLGKTLTLYGDGRVAYEEVIGGRLDVDPQ